MNRLLNNKSVVAFAISLCIMSGSVIGQTSNSIYFDDLERMFQLRHLIDNYFPGKDFELKLDTNIKETQSEKFIAYKTTISSNDLLANKILQVYHNYLKVKTELKNQQIPNSTKENGKIPQSGGNTQPPVADHGPSLEEETYETQNVPDNSDTDNEIKNELISVWLITSPLLPGRTEFLKHFIDAPSQFIYLTALLEAMTSVTNTFAPVTVQSNNLNLVSGTTFNEATIIYGITDWAIKNAKQEILESVLDGYYDKLHNNSITNTLLSHTLQTFNQFKQDNTVNLSKYGDLWKASFQEDLRSIPSHLQNEIFVSSVIDKINSSWPAKPEMVPLIAGSSSIVYGIYQKKHLVNILGELASDYSTGAVSVNQKLPLFKRAVLLTNIVTGITGTLDDNIYKSISIETLKKMTIPKWKGLLAMIYLRERTDLTLVFNKDPLDILNEIKVGPNAKFYNLLVSSITSYQAIQEILSNHVTTIGLDAEAKKVSYEEMNKIMNIAGVVVKNVLPVILNISPVLIGDASTINPIITNWDEISNSISQIGDGVTTKQYGTVLSGTLQLLAFADQNFSNGHPQLSEMIKTFTKYGSFMVNVLSAKSSDAIESALDELIPKNQYKLKNVCATSISISTYPGVFYGTETINKFNTNGTTLLNTTYKSTSRNLSLYLPIGIDFCVGFGKSSLILFVQALDFGSVLNYRLSKTDSTEGNNPNISFQQLLSPGASIMYQFPNTPFVMGFGLNYTPSLRKVQQAANTYNSNALRIGVFLGVDVTAFHLSLSKRRHTNL